MGRIREATCHRECDVADTPALPRQSNIGVVVGGDDRSDTSEGVHQEGSMSRDELIAYFSRGLRAGRGSEPDEEVISRCAASLADAFLENRVERPEGDAGHSARYGG